MFFIITFLVIYVPLITAISIDFNLTLYCSFKHDYRGTVTLSTYDYSIRESCPFHVTKKNWTWAIEGIPFEWDRIEIEHECVGFPVEEWSLKFPDQFKTNYVYDMDNKGYPELK